MVRFHQNAYFSYLGVQIRQVSAHITVVQGAGKNNNIKDDIYYLLTPLSFVHFRALLL